jgi:hypothetical protein
VAFVKKLEIVSVFIFCAAAADDDGEPGFDFVFRREYCQFNVI